MLEFGILGVLGDSKWWSRGTIVRSLTQTIYSLLNIHSRMGIRYAKLFEAAKSMFKA